MRAFQELVREGHKFRWGEWLFEQRVFGVETVSDGIRTRG